MAQNISLLGADYSDVPAVQLPKTGGGTASFTDVTDTTAAAGDVASGKYFYTAAGVRTAGTATGGGTVTITDTTDTHGGTIRTITTDPAATIVEALNITQNGTYTPSAGHAYGPVVAAVAGGGGLVYETGTYTPSADTAQPTISFANAHTTVPFFVAITETDTSNISNSSVQYWSFYEAYQITGGIYKATTTQTYGDVFYRYITNTGTVTFNAAGLYYPSTNSGNSSSSYARYWATETAFHPFRQASGTYFIAGHTYKWIAVWK